jgi:hypothetical protein
MLLHVCTQPRRADGTGGGRGKRVGGVLRYLFGPGRAEEHLNSRYAEAEPLGTRYGRLIAVSGGKPLEDLQPRATPRGCYDFRALVRWLEELPRAAGVLRRADGWQEGPGWVWHASLRLAPQDRHRSISDQMWAHIVQEVLRGAGLIADPDEAGVRWVAVRHAEDHVHIVASLVREDGRREWFRNDFSRCVNATAEVAVRMGLRQVGLGQRTAPRRPHPVEVHKAARQGRFTGDGQVLTVRDELRRRVRAAAAGAGSVEEFLTGLDRHGVKVAFRESGLRPGARTGIKFALAADTSAGGGPVWFGGGRLAPDLTWPKLCSRWAAPPLPGLGPELFTGLGRGQVIAEAERIVRRAAAGIGRAGPADAAAMGQAAAEAMTVAAWRLDRGPDGHRVRAAEHFDAAVRLPGGRPAPPSPQTIPLHALTQALYALQLAADDQGERDTLRLMYALCQLAERLARLHHQRGRHQQAANARAAATIRADAPPPLLRRGQQLSPAERALHAQTVTRVLPDAAPRILAEPGWDALAATLHDIHTTGADPAEALRVAACRRPPTTVPSVSGLLTWRIRGQAGLHRQQPTDPRARPDQGLQSSELLAEVLVYLAQRGGRGANPHRLDEDLWPGQDVKVTYRRATISRARQWAGRRPDGTPWLAEIHYRLEDGHLLDWHLFRRLRARGQARGPAGRDDLQAALELVCGMPLEGYERIAATTRSPYNWLPTSDIDPDHITAAIIDTAHELAQLYLADGDATGARWAVQQAWLADPDRNYDQPWHDLLAAQAADGHGAELAATVRELMRAREAEVEEDLDPATFTLLREILPSGYWDPQPAAART